MNPSIFHAYDVRGVYGKDFTPEDTKTIAKAYVTFLKPKTVVVGYDMRSTSKEIEQAVVESLVSFGVQVYRIGQVSTPMLYFAVNFLRTDGGIMITASHNPAEFNGMKLVREKAIMMHGGSSMYTVRNIALAGNFQKVGNAGSAQDKDITQAYREHVVKCVSPDRVKNLNVVIDASNSMGAFEFNAVSPTYSALSVSKLYFDLDGNFPNHEADPMKSKNMQDVIAAVQSQQADLGIVLDGDGDRIGVVDEQGVIVPNDFILALLAQEAMSDGRRLPIVGDLRSSRAVREFIAELGGTLIISPVGNPNLKDRMRENHSPVGGELTGHFFFEESDFAEATILVFLKICALMSKTGKKLSELVKPLQRYYRIEETNSVVADKESKLKEISEKYKDGAGSRLDGISVDYTDWWFNVRASNTENKIRLNLEANSKELMEQKRDELLAIIRG